MTKDIRINGQRLWDSLMVMAEIGATKRGGCNRQALTDEDKRGRDLFAKWCRDSGCTVSVDEMLQHALQIPGELLEELRVQNNVEPITMTQNSSYTDLQGTPTDDSECILEEKQYKQVTDQPQIV